MSRPAVKRRTNGESRLTGLGRAMGGLFSGRMVTGSPAWEQMENELAKTHGQAAYYRDASSSREIKRKVAIKMGGR